MICPAPQPATATAAIRAPMTSCARLRRGSLTSVTSFLNAGHRAEREPAPRRERAVVLPAMIARVAAGATGGSLTPPVAVLVAVPLLGPLHAHLHVSSPLSIP